MTTAELAGLECKCTSRVLTRRTFRNGTHHYCYQCISCGANSNSIKRDVADKLIASGENCEPYDEGRAEAYHAMLRKMNSLNRIDKKERRQAEYLEYLQSPEWKARRGKVIERAGALCEGCRENQAVIVHHLDYSHCGNELLYQLVALCKDCHDRAHGVVNE